MTKGCAKKYTHGFLSGCRLSSEKAEQGRKEPRKADQNQSYPEAQVSIAGSRGRSTGKHEASMAGG